MFWVNFLSFTSALLRGTLSCLEKFALQSTSKFVKHFFSYLPINSCFRLASLVAHSCFYNMSLYSLLVRSLYSHRSFRDDCYRQRSSVTETDIQQNVFLRNTLLDSSYKASSVSIFHVSTIRFHLGIIFSYKICKLQPSAQRKRRYYFNFCAHKARMNGVRLRRAVTAL